MQGGEVDLVDRTRAREIEGVGRSGGKEALGSVECGQVRL
jgi:hypothetical protein